MVDVDVDVGVDVDVDVLFVVMGVGVVVGGRAMVVVVGLVGGEALAVGGSTSTGGGAD